MNNQTDLNVEVLKEMYYAYNYAYVDANDGTVTVFKDKPTKEDMELLNKKRNAIWKKIDYCYLRSIGAKIERELLDMTDQIQYHRSIVTNYSEYKILTEFLINMETEFKVTKIKDDMDMMTITLI